MNVSIEHGKHFERGQGQVRAGAPPQQRGGLLGAERFPCSLSLAPEASFRGLAEGARQLRRTSTWTAKATPSTRKARWLCRGPVLMKPSRQQSPGARVLHVFPGHSAQCAGSVHAPSGTYSPDRDRCSGRWPAPEPPHVSGRFRTLSYFAPATLKRSGTHCLLL